MIIDSKGKLFGKVSIIDILIIVIAVGAIAGVGYKFKKSDTPAPFITTTKDKITLVLYSKEINEFTANSIKVGDTVKEIKKGTPFGKVKEVKLDKPFSPTTNDKGEWVVDEKPGYVSFLLTVEAEGRYNDTGITLGNEDYYIGQQLENCRIGDVAIDYAVVIREIKRK